MIEYYYLPNRTNKEYTEKFLVKIMADYFFYTFQEKINFDTFIKLGEFISNKDYMDIADANIKLTPIWNTAYFFLKAKKYRFLYSYFYVLRVGYIIKYLRRT